MKQIVHPQNLKERLLSVIREKRKRLLDICEASIERDRFRVARSQILNCLGDRGLEGDVERIIDGINHGRAGNMESSKGGGGMKRG